MAKIKTSNVATIEPSEPLKPHASQDSKLNYVHLISWIAIAGLGWFAGYCNKVNNGGELSWARSIYQQKVALAQNAKGLRRLIFVGGSGTHFGVNAQQIEKKLSIPTFNLGMHGYLGLNTVLDSVTGEIQRGDTIVLMMEHRSLADDDGIDRLASPFGAAILHPGLGGAPAKEVALDLLNVGLPGLRGISNSFVEFVRQKRSPRYYSDQLNDRGDPIVLKIRKIDPEEVPLSISQHARQRIKQFRDRAKLKGATLVLALPWMYVKKTAQTVRNVQKTVVELAKSAPVIYDKNSLNLQTDATLFGDTVYHLSYKGRTLRSAELVQQLKPKIVN